MPGKGKDERRSLLDGVFSGRLDRDYLRELRDLYYFYLSEEDRQRLAEMGRFKRAFLLLFWTVKNMLLRISPQRRFLILLASAVFIIGDTQIEIPRDPPEGVVVTDQSERVTRISFDLRLPGFLLLMLVLMLELKDKLVARDEILIARQVQMALLPNVHPDLPGWVVWSYTRPARDVGGDLVDYLEMDGFRHGVLIGDVAGKGLGAALLAAKLQATLRALVPDSVALDDLGARVNGIFANDGIGNRYATLFYAVLEYHSSQVRYLNAGHNPVLIQRRDRVERLDASSFPIGMFDMADYEECSIDMEPGDLLFAYSDGLTEAEDARGDEFGIDRVEEVLGEMRDRSPEEIGQRMLRDVDRFVGEVGHHDDLSLVIVAKR